MPVVELEVPTMSKWSTPEPVIRGWAADESQSALLTTSGRRLGHVTVSLARITHSPADPRNIVMNRSSKNGDMFTRRIGAVSWVAAHS